VIPPVKSAEYKVTVATNRDAVQLVTLFGDMLVQVRQHELELGVKPPMVNKILNQV
jgi:hypothetical protein